MLYHHEEQGANQEVFTGKNVVFLNNFLSY